MVFAFLAEPVGVVPGNMAKHQALMNNLSPETAKSHHLLLMNIASFFRIKTSALFLCCAVENGNANYNERVKKNILNLKFALSITI